MSAFCFQQKMKPLLVEQVCHIEQYKKEVFLKEGRLLSGDEAAAEWIEKFANQFPQNPN
jgi:hypothetical protein